MCNEKIEERIFLQILLDLEKELNKNIDNICKINLSFVTFMMFIKNRHSEEFKKTIGKNFIQVDDRKTLDNKIYGLYKNIPMEIDNKLSYNKLLVRLCDEMG
jgi:hypothetical protein